MKTNKSFLKLFSLKAIATVILLLMGAYSKVSAGDMASGKLYVNGGHGFYKSEDITRSQLDGSINLEANLLGAQGGIGFGGFKIANTVGDVDEKFNDVKSRKMIYAFLGGNLLNIHLYGSISMFDNVESKEVEKIKKIVPISPGKIWSLSGRLGYTFDVASIKLIPYGKFRCFTKGDISSAVEEVVNYYDAMITKGIKKTLPSLEEAKPEDKEYIDKILKPTTQGDILIIPGVGLKAELDFEILKVVLDGNYNFIQNSPKSMILYSSPIDDPIIDTANNGNYLSLSGKIAYTVVDILEISYKFQYVDFKNAVSKDAENKDKAPYSIKHSLGLGLSF